MLKIKFKYRDAYTLHDHWSEQECVMDSVQACIDFYGLNQPDVEFQIISVEVVE